MLEAPDRVHPRRWCQGQGAPHSGHPPSGHPQHVRQDHSECGRAGVDAYGWDCALERRPWGFAFDEIGADMWIFHGEQDWAVQPSEARTLAAGRCLDVYSGPMLSRADKSRRHTRNLSRRRDFAAGVVGASRLLLVVLPEPGHHRVPQLLGVLDHRKMAATLDEREVGIRD